MRLGTALRTLFVPFAAVVLSGSTLVGRPAAEKYSAAELKEPAPEQLAADVREGLGKTGYRVADSSGKTICDVWLRAELPVLEKFTAQNDVTYPIEPGTLIGAIRFPAANSDYRKQSIKSGTYTLRYGHQPQDGNHLGTAQNRDFAIASLAAEDKSPEGMSQEKAMEQSKKASGTTHPAIFSLLPPQEGRGKLPTMAHEDTLNLEVLVAKTTAKKGAPTKEVQIELVTVGHAPE